MWNLSDAIVDRDRPRAAAAAARLSGQGESVTPLVYQMAKRLREARLALAGLEAGRSPRELEASLPMHPYAAKLLLRRVKGAELDLASRLHMRGRRPRVVDPGRFRLSRGGRAGARRGESHARKRLRAGRALRGGAGAHACGASLLAGAGVPVEGALLHGLVDLRDERAVLGRQRPRNRPAATAASRRLKCVFTAPVKWRFSVRSRMVRALRLRCEAILAMKRRRMIAA